MTRPSTKPSDRPGYDWILAGLGALVSLFIIVAETGHAERLAVYQSGATVASILGGLGALACSIYATTGAARAQLLRAVAGGRLRRNWIAILTGTVIAVALSIVAQSIDGAWPRLAMAAFGGGMGLALARAARLTWLFSEWMRLLDREDTEEANSSEDVTVNRMSRAG